MCQNEVTNPLGKGRLGGVDCEFACAHAMIAKQTFILHFRHIQHQTLVLEVSEVRVVFLLHNLVQLRGYLFRQQLSGVPFLPVYSWDGFL